MMNSGTSTSMPQRMPTCPVIQPISGSTSRPGITHSDATENPVARARGGIASESATRMPGPSIASDGRDHAVDGDRDDDVRRDGEPDRGDRRGDGDACEEADQSRACRRGTAG